MQKHSLIRPIPSREYLRARRPVLHLLDGLYASLQRGRSMEFDDLREYAPGDEVGDIDWNATARVGTPLVRRWIDDRRHRVFFAVDDGRDLQAQGASGDRKRDLAIAAIGALGYLALRHGDEIGMVAGSSAGAIRRPARATRTSLEAMLQQLEDAPGTATSDLGEVLDFAASSLRQRSLFVVVADELTWDGDLEERVRRLCAQHEVVWLEIADVDLSEALVRNEMVRDVANGWQLPAALRNDPQLRDEYEVAVKQRRLHMLSLFASLGVSFARLESLSGVVDALLHLLERRKHGHV